MNDDFIRNFEKWGVGYFNDLRGDFKEDFKFIKSKVERKFEFKIEEILNKTGEYDKEELEYVIGWKRGYKLDAIKGVSENNLWSNATGGRRIDNLNKYIGLLYDHQDDIKNISNSADMKKIYMIF